jgi:catechol 2,3-dioxygenase-like lactoylglutathione lyase family enzyme
MASSKLVHVGLAVSDVEQALRFWRDALGLEVVADMGDYMDLSDGHHNFRIFQHQGRPRPPHVSGLESYLHLGVQVPDLRAAVNRCTALGFPIAWEAVDDPRPISPGELPTRSFKVEDPDGIVVDVTASEDQWPGINLK